MLSRGNVVTSGTGIQWGLCFAEDRADKNGPPQTIPIPDSLPIAFSFLYLKKKNENESCSTRISAYSHLQAGSSARMHLRGTTVA